LGPLEYLEQPCATVAELAELRRHIGTPVAADESIRKARTRWLSPKREPRTSPCSKSHHWAAFQSS